MVNRGYPIITRCAATQRMKITVQNGGEGINIFSVSSVNSVAKHLLHYYMMRMKADCGNRDPRSDCGRMKR